MTRLALASLILFSASSFAAPMYKWVDENGVTHFSERPPAEQPDMQAVDINGIPIVSGEEELAERNRMESSVDSDDDEPGLIPEVEKIENPVKSPELCEQARQNLTQIRNNRRVRAPDPETGELRYLNEDEIAEQQNNWQKRAETFCD